MATAGKGRAPRQRAAELPVARVCVDVPLAHLDRPFDYLVPTEFHEIATPGVRVRVRFAGQLLDGWLLERVAESGHGGQLRYLERVVSAERVLSPEIARLARAVADRYAGNLADVLRLAVPPRHARAEKAATSKTTASLETVVPAESTVSLETVVPAESTAPQAAIAVPATTASPVSNSLAENPAPIGLASDAAAPSASGTTVEPVAGTATVDALAVGGGWAQYSAGPAYLRALAQGRPARAVWSVLPGEDWPARIAEAVATSIGAGRGVVAVVPDARDLQRLDAALLETLGPGRHVALSAALGPAERYRRFLAARRGVVSAVIGTRAAMFAPVERLGLVVLWDDGDDSHAEPRAPYPHAREVLLTRAQQAGAAALLGGFARSTEGQLLVDTGWARQIVGDRGRFRARVPEVVPTGDDPQLARDPAAATARLPSVAWQAARAALRAGAPVLVQVPRRGYLPAVSCLDCQTRAHCPHCAGPLGLRAANTAPNCRWCGRTLAAYSCPNCGGRRLRATVVGVRRTAEELGRAFPGVPVRTSGRDEVLVEIPAGPALVVATPGAEPVAVGGYGAVLLLDSWALLTRADLRAIEEALRRWMNAAALARSRAAGGRVVVAADASLAPVQALLRWDPGWYAARELAERRELGFPPAVRMASLTGVPAAVAEVLAQARLPASAQLLGPVPAGPDEERMLIRVSRADAARLACALHQAVAVRTARKAPDAVRVQVDPLELL